MEILIQRLSIFLTALLLGCSTQSIPADVILNYDVTELNRLCSEDVAYDSCTELNGKNVVVKGRLFTEVYNLPTVYPANAVLSDFEFENDDEPNGINLPMNKCEAAELKKFDGKLVTVTGKIHTECVLKYRDAKIHEKEINDKRNSGDDFVITMLTGTCHYVGRYITDPIVQPVSRE